MTITPPAALLTGERVTLEPLRPDHAAEMVDVLDDHALYAFTGGEPPTRERLEHRYTMLCAGSGDDAEQWHNWIVRHVHSNATIGYVQATATAIDYEVAWLIGTAWQGQGYASEAAKIMCGWLRENGAQPFTAWIHPNHAQSHGVARAIGLSPTNEIDDDGEARWRG